MLPTPAARDTKGRDLPTRTGGPSLPTALLPTPAVNDMGRNYSPEAWDAWTTQMRTLHRNGNGHGPSLAVEGRRLLATPTASVAKGGRPQNSRGKRDLRLDARADWGKYAHAVHRWETILGRKAPAFIVGGRVNPAFLEWMMGYPAGWVTAVPGMTHRTATITLGNGCVPQQAEAAVRLLLRSASGSGNLNREKG